MMDHELQNFMKEHPWLDTVQLPEGWNRIRDMPLRERRLYFLMPNGEICELPPSNTVLLTMRIKPIAWRRIEDNPSLPAAR